MGIRDMIHQGDIIIIENIRNPVLVVSKDFFNHTGEIIGCPVFTGGQAGPLHIYIQSETISGYVQCEKLALLDLNVRRYRKSGSISTADIINITDAVQGIFDYM